MSKGSVVVLLGIVVVLVAIAGLPSMLKAGALIVIGLTIAGIGFLVREEKAWLIEILRGERVSGAHDSHESPSKSVVAE